MENDIPYIFFGTGEIARGCLDELAQAGLIPSLIITAPPRPKGRGNTLTPSLVAQWAQAHNVRTLTPENIGESFITDLKRECGDLNVEVFLLADYGKILPKALLDIPPRGILNMHPSLLPRLRGPSPIRSAILTDERDTGVSIMLVDEKMDHGPIVAQKAITLPEWPMRGHELDALLAREGGRLLAESVRPYLRGELVPREQDHTQATFSKFIRKENAQINPTDDAYTNLLKIRAYDGWPGAFTFFEKDSKKIRVKILDAHIDPPAGGLTIDRVVPEGKGEMSYEEFLHSGASPL